MPSFYKPAKNPIVRLRDAALGATSNQNKSKSTYKRNRSPQVNHPAQPIPKAKHPSPPNASPPPTTQVQIFKTDASDTPLSVKSSTSVISTATKGPHAGRKASLKQTRRHAKHKGSFIKRLKTKPRNKSQHHLGGSSNLLLEPKPKARQTSIYSTHSGYHAAKDNKGAQYTRKGFKERPGSVYSKTSLMHTHKLLQDGRHTPDHFKKVALAASSPSQLSVKSISEYYNIPDNNFNSPDDVFRYRGYKKLGKIDEGAFGIVSKAMRLSDKILVAVKEVDLRRKKAKRIEEMKRELFVLQKIEHNNVVQLIEHFIIGHMLVIIMEFCAGGNLTSYLKETAISEQEALHLFKQMALAIKCLHKKGIAHRDVKLNNFLLDSTRKIVKVGDFGLSVVSYKHTQGILMAKTYCGTEPYMAPEILRRNSMGVRSYNPLYSDIWSLGVCLFAMLTRTFPFRMQNSQNGLYRAQIIRKWRFPRSLREALSEEIKDLVWHMLDPEPERRITINGIVAHPWLNHGELIELSYDEAETVGKTH